MAERGGDSKARAPSASIGFFSIGEVPPQTPPTRGSHPPAGGEALDPRRACRWPGQKKRWRRGRDSKARAPSASIGFFSIGEVPPQTPPTRVLTLPRVGKLSIRGGLAGGQGRRKDGGEGGIRRRGRLRVRSVLSLLGRFPPQTPPTRVLTLPRVGKLSIRGGLAGGQGRRKDGGEGGIRTLGPSFPGQPLSKRTCSATPAPLRGVSAAAEGHSKARGR